MSNLIFPRQLAALLILFVVPVFAQDNVPPLDGNEGRQLLLEHFRPKSQLKVAEHHLTRAKFPVVDVHTHFFVRTRHSAEQRDNYVALMDRNQIAICASLDGRLGDRWDEHADHLWKEHRERFVIFVTLDFQGDGKADDPKTWDCQRPDFGRRIAKQLAEAKTRGASGVKFFKEFGLTWKDANGSLLRIDDERWNEIWRACGELGLPVLMHVADPVAFFLPIDHTNERWEELHRRPQWSFHGPQFPKREELLAAFLRVVKQHPQTNFIGAHVASNAEDLGAVSEWLDAHPNLYVEFASRIAELGRQPYSARRFCVKYADRILFGSDGPWPEQRVRYYWRFLETWDENFPYSEKEFPPQGMWNIYGLGLPDDVLRKIYHENAAKLIPGVKERLVKVLAK